MTEKHDHDHDHDHAHEADHGHGHGDAHEAAHGHESGHDDHGHMPKHRATRHSSAHTAGHDKPATPYGGPTPADLLRGTATVLILALVLLPFFFVIYRLALFETGPHEGYARFLLHLLGRPGGVVPGAPYGYHGLAVLAAVPFFFSLPAALLAPAPGDLPFELARATGSLVVLSHLCLAGTLYTVYRLARDRAGQDAATALLAAALMFVLFWYTDYFALDPLAILLIALGLYALANRPGFAVLLLATPVINEQIAVVFALWLSLRCLTSQADRDALGLQWATAIVALLIYAALIVVVQLPGGGHQFDPATYAETLRTTLAAQATPAALLLTVPPIVLLLGLGLFGHFGWPRRDAGRPTWNGRFRRVDLLLIPILAAVELAQMFEPGRLVMLAAPLFVVPAATVLLHRLAGRPAAEGHAP